MIDTVCPRGSDPFYIIGYYIKWVKTSWTDGKVNVKNVKHCMTNKFLCKKCIFDYKDSDVYNE